MSQCQSCTYFDFDPFYFQLTQCIDYSFVKNDQENASFSQSQSAVFWGGYHGSHHEIFTRSDSVLSKYSSSSFSDSNEASGCLDLTTHNRNRQRCISISVETPDAIDLSKPRSSNSHDEANASATMALYVETVNPLNPLLISNERISPSSPLSVDERFPATISHNNISPKSIANVKSELAAEKEISAKNIASEFLKIANQQDSHHSISTPDLHGHTLSNSNKRVNGESLVACGSANDPLAVARTVVVSEDGFTTKSSNSNDLPTVPLSRDGCTSTASQAYIQEDRDGPGRCELCQQKFSKRSALLLHMNIHYMNPTKKKKRNTIEATNTSTPTSTTINPRPFECVDCHKAFRNHGFLTKHFLSKMHVQTLECLEKLPVGTYALIADAGISVNKLKDIDTTDYDSSLASFKKLAEKLKSESNTSHGKNYENYTSDTQSNDDTESKPGDESLESDGYDCKRRRLNENHTDEFENE